MKIDFQDTGTMIMTPENGKEDIFLRGWYKSNKGKSIESVIIFERLNNVNNFE